MKRKFTFLIAAAVMLLTMMATTGEMWGQSRTETTTTYTFTSASWTATSGGSAANWTSGQNGAGFINNGIQVTTNSTGANGTSPVSFTNVTKIVATYNTNKSAGAGSIVAQIGTNTATTNSVAYPGSGDGRTGNYTTEFDYTTAQTGNVKITVNTTTNSIYLVSVAITTNDGTSPSISASNVEIAYDAEGGSIEYTLANATGNVSASVTTGDWLTLGTVTASEVPFTCSANEGAAARTATVTLSFTGASNKVVTITQAGDPNAPGTQNNPYTVAQARAAIDAGTGTQGVYATGIVSAIPYAYTSNNGITFNMVDESGDQVFLQAYKCTGNDAPNVLVNDVVVVYGNLTKYSTTYEFGSGCQIVSLVHPSTPYITANDVEITYDTEADEIEYTINNPVSGGVLTASTESDWLTLGDVDETIPFTCSTNTAANSRTATVTLTYTYGAKTTVNKEVTVTQAGNPEVYNNISDITEVGTAYSVKGTVVAINSRGFVMGDGTGYVYYYKNAAPTQAVNDMVTVAGTTGTYGQIIQFTNSATVGEATTSSYNNTPAATVITAIPDYSTGYHLSTYLEFEGALEKSGSNYLITVGEGENNQIQISYPTTAQGTALTALDGKTVHVKGYFTGINSSSKFTVMLESAVEVAVPAITLAQYEYNLNADGGNAELPVTYTNMPANPQAEVIFYEANGTTTATYDWITASINANYNIAGHINVNEGDARSAYFKVKGKDANNNDVYSNLVTINQAAAGATIEFNNTSMTLAAGGESDRQLSFDYSGLGSNPTFSINYYEQDGTTAATYNHDWLTATIEGDKVNISAVANTGAERKAYFKVYGEGNNTNAESNLVTITQAAYVVDYAELPFNWAGNTSTPTGITNNGVGTYSSSPYLKFDGTGDYIVLKINERPGTLSFDIKGNSFGNGSIFKLQTSVDGTTYDDLKTYTELGATTLNESFDNLDENVRYIKWIYTEKVQNGGNVALGNIVLAKYAAPVPSITAEDVNIAYDATEGSITYTINNPVEGGSMSSMPISGGDWLTVGGPLNGSVALTCEQNTGAERTATVRLTYTYNNPEESVTEDVTVTQAGVPATMYVVNFNLDDGTFVPNDDFPQDVVEKEAGTYTLPSATKAGYDFTGWNDGDQTYAAGAEYTVSGDVNFTAQWTESTTGTIVFGTNNVKINAAEVSGKDSMDNTWTITTEGTSSFTQNAAYSQVGSSSSPATSITFTMTLPQQKTISAFEAKFGGFGGTAGDITLNVGNETVGSGSLNGSTDVIVAADNTTEVGTVLTVTVTNIDKGVKCYYISYTLSDAPVVPVIDATAGSALAYNATAGSIIYEIANYESGTMTATTTADWINTLVVTTPTDEDGEVTFNVTTNTSNESRSATVTLTFTYGDPATTVTKDVTVTQNGQPSITVTPATANVAFVGGAPEFAITYESLEITKADDFDVEFYETSTSTTAGTQPAWITNAAITGNTTDGFTLTVTVAANDGAAREAYLKVSAAGDSDYIYSNIVTVSQDAYSQLTTYSLVESVNDIISGKHYIIATGSISDKYYAIGEQNGQYRNPVEVTVNNNSITYTEGLYEFVLNGDNEHGWTIYDKITPGFLVQGNKALSIGANGTAFSISIDTENNYVATISNSNYSIQYNSSNPRFACYSSNQQVVYLYVKNNDNNLEYYGTEITYQGSSIPDGGSITVGTGSVVRVPNGFTNDSPDNLVIEDGGQLVFDGTGVQATMKKSTAHAGAKDVATDWYTIASPLAANVATNAVGNLTNGTYDLYRYNEATVMWENAKDTEHSGGFNELTVGRGYLYWNGSGSDITFAGELRNADVAYTLKADGAGNYKGFNLIGNPFSQNITMSNITGVTLSGGYVLTQAGGWGASIDEIAPCQGFLVQVEAETDITITKPTSSSKSRTNRDYLAFTVANAEYEDVAYAMFEEATGLSKINHRNADIPMVYIPQNGQNYAIATMDDNTQAFELNFKAMTTGQYTLSYKAEGKYSYLHVIDRLTGEDIDMLLEGEYSFIGSPRDAEDRFVVRLSYSATIDGNNTNIFAYQSGSDIIVSGNGELQVFDVMGRMVATMHVNGVQTMSTSSLQTGMYIFRLNEKSQKIVVR